jgi:DNA-binding MarR family transcriptional regulator
MAMTPAPAPAAAALAVDQEMATRTRLAVLRLARRLRQQVHAGVTPSQQSALSAIEHRGPLTLGELAAIENVRPPSISRIVGALEDQGYVDRTTDPTDRRVSTIATTTKGRRELRRIRAERNAWLASRLALLDLDEKARLEDALPVLEKMFGGET